MADVRPVQAFLWSAVAFAAGAFVYEHSGIVAGRLTSGLIALNIPSIVYSAEIMSEAVFTACFALAVIIALHAVNKGTKGYSPLGSLTAASFLLAYAVLTRPIGAFGLLAPAILVVRGSHWAICSQIRFSGHCLFPFR